MPTLYWKNVSSTRWFDAPNWFLDAAATQPALNAPWDLYSSRNYDAYDLTMATGATSPPVIQYGDIAASATGTCDIAGVMTYGSIYGGVFTGSGLTNSSIVYGGTWLASGQFNFRYQSQDFSFTCGGTNPGFPMQLDILPNATASDILGTGLL